MIKKGIYARKISSNCAYVVITSQDSITSIFPFDEEHPYPLPLLLEASINHKYLNEASARNKRGRNKKNDPPRSIF